MITSVKKIACTFLAACLLCTIFPVTAFAASQKAILTETSNLIGVDAAKKAALDHIGASSDEATFTTAKLDYDDGVAEYEIKFTWNGIKFDYEINAVSGNVTGYSQKAQKRAEAKPTPNSVNYIGVDKAKEIALTHAGVTETQAVFTKSKLDYDDGSAEYEIEFYAGGMEYEYEINASTCVITDYDLETYERR